MHDEALGFSWHALDGAIARHGAGRGQIRFRASHPFCSCGSFARMMPRLSIPSLQTRELPSAFRTLAGVLCCTSQVSFDSLRSILSQGGLKMICRRSRHSFWQLGRPNFHERSMPFIPRQRHFHPPQTSSHQASSQPLPLAPAPRVSYCVVTTPSWKRESLDEKTWGQGRHFGPLRPSFGQKLHSLHTHTQ